MPKTRFNDRWIRTLKPTESRVDYWDELTPGLGLRVTTAGKKTFFCRYRVGKAQRRMTLGDYPALSLVDARRKFQNTHLNVGDGKDPQAEKREAKLAETVGELFQTFFDDREGRIADSTLKRYRGTYRREFEKTIGMMKAKDLRKAHVIPILRNLAKRAPTQSHRAYQLIQGCLNYGVGLDLIEFNPLHKMPTFGYTRIGERYLSPEEVVVYLRKVEELAPVEKIYFRLLLLFGARPGEMSKWQWAWIKSDRIFVPGDFQKNGRPLVLPITPGSERLLNELREISSHTPWLFPNPFETAPRKSFGKNKVRLQDKMKLNEHWTMRDLRRTTETLLRELRIRPEVVAVILNHNTSQLRKIYDKSESLPEKRKALLRYEKYLERLRTKGVPEKVVELGEYRASLEK